MRGDLHGNQTKWGCSDPTRSGEEDPFMPAARDDPRGLHDGLGASSWSIHRLPQVDTPLLDHVYCGDAFPKLNEGDPHYLRPETISGSFAVESWLEDHLGRYSAVINNGEGSRWVVFEMEHLERVG